MEYTTRQLIHMKVNRGWYLTVWFILASFYAILVVEGFKYIGYILFAENIAPFIVLWLIILFLTSTLVHSGIYIFYIEKIVKIRRENGRERKTK